MDKPYTFQNIPNCCVDMVLVCTHSPYPKNFTVGKEYTVAMSVTGLLCLFDDSGHLLYGTAAQFAVVREPVDASKEDLNTPEARAELYGCSNPNFPEKRPEPVSSFTLLQDCMDIQQERGKQYDAKGSQERSFKRVATAFNAITQGDLKGSDIALILQILKDVRLYTNLESLHEDSVLDKISYASLHGEEMYTEFKDKNDG